MSTRNDWARRWTKPDPRIRAEQPDREQAFRDTVRYVHDMYELGAFLYDIVITDEPESWFRGTGDSIMTAITRRLIAKPAMRVNATMLNHALILYSGHTFERLDRWIDGARTVSAGSYISWLARNEGVKPFTTKQRSPLEVEAMKAKRVKR